MIPIPLVHSSRVYDITVEWPINIMNNVKCKLYWLHFKGLAIEGLPTSKIALKYFMCMSYSYYGCHSDDTYLLVSMFSCLQSSA